MWTLCYVITWLRNRYIDKRYIELQKHINTFVIHFLFYYIKHYLITKNSASMHKLLFLARPFLLNYKYWITIINHIIILFHKQKTLAMGFGPENCIIGMIFGTAVIQKYEIHLFSPNMKNILKPNYNYISPILNFQRLWCLPVWMLIIIKNCMYLKYLSLTIFFNWIM